MPLIYHSIRKGTMNTSATSETRNHNMGVYMQQTSTKGGGGGRGGTFTQTEKLNNRIHHHKATDGRILHPFVRSFTGQKSAWVAPPSIHGAKRAARTQSSFHNQKVASIFLNTYHEIGISSSQINTEDEEGHIHLRKWDIKDQKRR